MSLERWEAFDSCGYFSFCSDCSFIHANGQSHVDTHVVGQVITKIEQGSSYAYSIPNKGLRKTATIPQEGISNGGAETKQRVSLFRGLIATLEGSHSCAPLPDLLQTYRVTASLVKPSHAIPRHTIPDALSVCAL